MGVADNIDTKNTLDIIYHSNACLDARKLQEVALPLLLQLFKSDSGLFYSTNNDYNDVLLNLENVVFTNIRESAMNQYSDYYCHLDPHFSKVTASSMDVFQTSDILSISQWENSIYYNEHTRPRNCHRMLYICLRSNDALYGFIVINRSKHSDFSSEDVFTARVLAPHLTNALRNAICYSKINSEAMLLRLVAEESDEGIIIFDYRLHPLYVNYKAKELCFLLSHNRPKQTFVLNGTEISMPYEILPVYSFLEGRNAPDEQYFLNNRDRLIKTNDNGLILVRHVLMPERSQISSSRYLTVSLKEILKSDGEIEISKFHLTSRECDILHLINNGLSNKEIAERLSISKLTVETHLKNIFKKTGVNSRLELGTRFPVSHYDMDDWIKSLKS